MNRTKLKHKTRILVTKKDDENYLKEGQIAVLVESDGPIQYSIGFPNRIITERYNIFEFTVLGEEK